MNKESGIRMDDYLYTIDELAVILKVGKNYVYDLIKKGYLVGLKLGRMKVTRYELERFLKENIGKDLTDLDNVKDIN